MAHRWHPVTGCLTYNDGAPVSEKHVKDTKRFYVSSVVGALVSHLAEYKSNTEFSKISSLGGVGFMHILSVRSD